MHHGHGHSGSVSYSTAEVDEKDYPLGGDGDLKTPSRRGTFSRMEMEASGTSGIPTPSGIPMPSSRRQSGGTDVGGRRSSVGGRKLEDVGETY